MALFQPTYTDKKTGKLKTSAVWWFEFIYCGKRIRESTKTTKKTIAIEAEKNRRLALERTHAGLPSEAPSTRVHSVGDRVTVYLSDYPINHRPKSVIFAKQRLAHVRRLLGKALISGCH